MGQLKKAGQLESSVAIAYEHLTLKMQESAHLYRNARETLQPHSRTPMPEWKVRELIHETGIPIFPRPKGIPDNYRVMVSDKGAGMKYMHPEHNHTSVRVMPGQPYSANPCQQSPYVIHKKNGKILDKYGNVVEEGRKAPETHIPLDEFIFVGY